MAFTVTEFPNRVFETFDELQKLKYLRIVIKERLKNRKEKRINIKIVLKKDSLEVMAAQLLMNSTSASRIKKATSTF